MPGLTREALEKLLRNYFEERLPKLNEIALLAPQDPQLDIGQEIAGLKQEIGELRQQIATRQHDQIVAIDAQEILTRAGLDTPAKGDENLEMLYHGILRARAEHRRVLLAMLQGRYDDVMPHDALFTGITTLALPPIGDEQADDSRSVQAIAEQYQKEKTKAKEWVTKTVNEHKRVLELFRGLVGSAKPIKLVSDDDVRNFKGVLMDLPPNYMKQSQFAAKAAQQVAKQASSSGAGGRAPKTAKK